MALESHPENPHYIILIVISPWASLSWEFLGSLFLMTLTIWRNSGQVCCLSIGNCILRIFFIIWQEFPFSCIFFSSSKASNSCPRQEKDRNWWPRTQKLFKSLLDQVSPTRVIYFLADIFFCCLAGKEKHWVPFSVHPWPFFDIDSSFPNIISVCHEFSPEVWASI